METRVQLDQNLGHHTRLYLDFTQKKRCLTDWFVPDARPDWHLHCTKKKKEPISGATSRADSP